MSIQSSINQMLSSIANQQLFKGLTESVGGIKKDTGTLTDEQKRLNELIQKHGSVQAVSDAAGIGKQTMDDELEARKNFEGFDNAVTGMSNMLNRIKNVSQTRVKMGQILAEDTQDAVKERYEQSKGGAQK